MSLSDGSQETVASSEQNNDHVSNGRHSHKKDSKSNQLIQVKSVFERRIYFSSIRKENLDTEKNRQETQGESEWNRSQGGSKLTYEESNRRNCVRRMTGFEEAKEVIKDCYTWLSVCTDYPVRNIAMRNYKRKTDRGTKSVELMQCVVLLVKEKKKQVEKKILAEESNKSSSSEEECFCLICCESYLDSVPGEGWVQCFICKGLAQDKCVNRSLTSSAFNCNNCDFDDD